MLGLISLADAEHRFEQVRPELEAKATARRPVTPDDYRARSVLFISEEARLSYLVNLPEKEDLGAAVDTAMRLVETHNTELKDVLPKGYQRLEKSTLVELLRLFAPLPRKLSGDAFGLIYEDFLSNFAAAEGRLGGESFTPDSIVRLIVEIIEPFHGRVLDPAAGSGGMFAQCAKFVERHQGSATDDLSVYGQEQKEVTVPLAKMNLAPHGLSGDIKLGNSYYDDLHHSTGAFDFVMANPPFNVDKVDKDKMAGDPRFPFGLPKPDNGNYIWIQAVFDHIVTAYGDDGASVYDRFTEAENVQRNAPSIGTDVAVLDRPDLDTVTERLIDQISEDAELASRVADRLGLAGGGALRTVAELVDNDEDCAVEFKSTARWDLREGQPSKVMEDAVVKTVAGFLNTDGGTLLIGVDNERHVLGLDHDYARVKPANGDGFVNWLTTHLINALGHTPVTRTRARVTVLDGHELCRLDVARSSGPVRATTSTADDVFFVRMNNSTRVLPEHEVAAYVAEHWPAP